MSKEPSIFNRLLSNVTLLVNLPASREIVVMLALINGPLLVALVAVKAYKIIFALWPVTHTFAWYAPTLGQLLLDHRTIRFLGSIVCGYFLYRGLIRKRSLLVFSIFALLVLGFASTIIALVIVKGGSLSEFVPLLQTKLSLYTSELYFTADIFRADIAFMLGFSIFVYIVLKLTPKPWQSLAFRVLLFLNTLLLIIVGIELVHYLDTGVTASGELLLYFLHHAFDDDFWSIVLSESNWATFVPIFATLLLGALSLLIIRFACGRLANDIQTSEKRLVATGRVIWPLLVVIFFLPICFDQQYLRLAGNTLTIIGRDVFLRPLLRAGRNIEASKLVNYDTSHLKLKATSKIRPLNVVIIMLESVRAQATSVYNPTLRNTPFLSELSQKALVVKDMHAVVPRTSAAWTSVLHGIYPSTNDVLIRWANKQAKLNTTMSLPKLLAEIGYRSAFFVPTHLKYENEGQLLSNMGFDHLVSEQNYDTSGFERTNYFGLEDRVMLRPILSWVDSQRKDNANFLLTIMTNIGHHKYEIPSSWRKEKFVDGEDKDFNNYLNCIAYIDDFLQQLFAGFSQRGLFESTIFFILGDHGDSFGEHGVRARALSLYEEDLHVPMLIFAPALYPNGGKIIGVRQQIDIIPTIADMLGYYFVGGKLPGLSLLAESPADRTIYFSAIFDQLSIAMLRGSKKYIYTFDRLPMEVYDLVADPQEIYDISESVSEDEIKSVETGMLIWSEQAKMTLASKPLQIQK